MKTQDNQMIVREYSAHTANAALSAACADFPEFTSCSKATANEHHSFTLYDVEGFTLGRLYIVTKADVKKGWADKSSLGSRLHVIKIKPERL